MNYDNINFKVKLVVGFRRDQEHNIDINEAHKAYYLFLNPQQRGVFNNGLAIRGEDIQEIIPDFQGTMGWNSTHTLDGDDWNEIKSKNIHNKIKKLLSAAKEIAQIAEISDIQKPLFQLIEQKYPKLLPTTEEWRETKVSSIAEIINSKKLSTGQV